MLSVIVSEKGLSLNQRQELPVTYSKSSGNSAEIEINLEGFFFFTPQINSRGKFYIRNVLYGTLRIHHCWRRGKRLLL